MGPDAFKAANPTKHQLISPLFCPAVLPRPCLQGYKLTDTRAPSAGDIWTFPGGTSLAPGQYLIVFASGKDRANPSAPLHTSFKLSADDGYLALLAPGGNVVNEVEFPE